jgi:hypothetical protein
MTVGEEADEKVAELVSRLERPGEYSFRIPGWAPVEAGEGLRWMRVSLGEGYDVEYRIDEARKLVVFKIWEYGEDEPEWDDPWQAGSDADE